jgi:hypothetical protein
MFVLLSLSTCMLVCSCEVNVVCMCNSVTEIQEDAEYQVEFSAGGHGMAIQVSLPPEFPLEKPVLKVSPQIDHPWVSEQCKIISAPGLLNVSVQCCEVLVLELFSDVTLSLFCTVHSSLRSGSRCAGNNPRV